MRYGIYVTFDAYTEQCIDHLRTSLKGVPQMAPHLTLLVFDHADHESVLNNFRKCAHHLKAFSITLKKVNAFTSKRHVLYLEPASSRALKNTYLHCLKEFSSSSIVPHYRSLLHWKPHITLAKHMNDSELHDMKAILEEKWTPRKAHVCVIGLINIQKPLDALASKILSSKMVK